METAFRFESLQIWTKAVAIGSRLYDIADELESRKLFRFADQLRGAALSISNNIAEGSGSTSAKEFAQFLNIARRSVFENANMIIVFSHREILNSVQRDELLALLREEAQMITGFSRSLRNRSAAGVALAVTLVAVGAALFLPFLR